MPIETAYRTSSRTTNSRAITSNSITCTSNNGHGFTEKLDPVVTVSLNSLCAQAADWDGDGDTDLVVCDQKRDYFYENTPTGFVDATSGSAAGRHQPDDVPAERVGR
jgi:hypothetical protein